MTQSQLIVPEFHLWRDVIRVPFAPGADPGVPAPLDPASIKRMGEVSQVVSATRKSLGKAVSEPWLFGGQIFFLVGPPQSGDAGNQGELLAELRRTAEPQRVRSALLDTARQILANSQAQGRTLPEVVRHPSYIHMLRTIATARDRSDLQVVLEVAGELPERFEKLAPCHFVERTTEDDETRRVELPLNGVFMAEDDNLVASSGRLRLYLPRQHFNLTSAELIQRIEDEITIFEGLVKTLEPNCLLALPGSRLVSQLRL